MGVLRKLTDQFSLRRNLLKAIFSMDVLPDLDLLTGQDFIPCIAAVIMVMGRLFFQTAVQHPLIAAVVVVMRGLFFQTADQIAFLIIAGFPVGMTVGLFLDAEQVPADIAAVAVDVAVSFFFPTDQLSPLQGIAAVIVDVDLALDFLQRADQVAFCIIAAFVMGQGTQPR